MPAAFPEVTQAFEALARALQSGELSAYHALAVEDAPRQDELFTVNSRRLREQQLSPRLLRVEQEGEVAEVSFTLVDAKGAASGEGTVTFTLEQDGWRLRAL